MNKLEQFIADKDLGLDPEPYSSAAFHDAVVPNAMQMAEEVLNFSPMSKRLQGVILTGYDRKITADTEFGKGQTGLTTLRGGYVINHAIRLARRSLSGDKRVEVGMKYPRFDMHQFVRKFKLARPIKAPNTLVLSRPENEKYRNEKSYPPYDMFVDPKGNVYTFEKGRAGEGGYAGAVFINDIEAFKFIDWLLGSPTHYLKDLDVGINCLGGYGIKDLERFVSYPAPARRALWKDLTKGERSHLREVGMPSLRGFKILAAKQVEMRAQHPESPEPCWICWAIAKRFQLPV